MSDLLATITTTTTAAASSASVGEAEGRGVEKATRAAFVGTNERRKKEAERVSYSRMARRRTIRIIKFHSMNHPLTLRGILDVSRRPL